MAMNQVPMWSRIMVALCCVHRGALGQLQFVVDPVSGVTFSLYGENPEWTWARAYNHCVSVGQRLAVIDNSSKQEAVNNFTEKGHAWIGGRRSPDVIWRWISGEEYEYDDGDAYLFEDSGKRCGAIGRLSSPSVHPSVCVVDSGPLPAVCQQLAQGASKRYWVTDTLFTSWNDARASCLDQGGDLAHPSSQERIQDWTAKMVDLIVDSVSYVWIGLSRHPWSWVTGDHTTLQVHRGALGQRLRQVVVDPVSRVNFSLYIENKEWTWERAYNHCVSVGQRLAVIDTSSKQEAVNRFIDQGHAWIGGQRSPDATWRWVSGEEYEYDDGDAYFFEALGTWCGALRVPWLHPHGCIGHEKLPAICQQGAQGTRMRYWFPDGSFNSWLDARTSCLEQEGDLAHPSYKQQLQDWTKDINGTADPRNNMWIGLSRHSWSWVTGDHTTLQAYRSMTYTHFSRGEGDGTNQTCAHLDMKGNQDNSWADNACDLHSRYFVCDDGPPLTTPSQPGPAQSTVTPPGPDPRQTEGGLTTAGTADPATDVAAVYRMLWVTVGVCVILVVAIIIIITFLLIKNRRLKKACSAAMATVPVVTPPAAVQHEPSSRDNEGSYGNLRTSQIESRDPGPYERLGDGAHYDFVGDPETGVEANGGRRIYQNVD